MKNSVKFEKAFNYFKENYDYKMGGSQTVVLPNGKSLFFDDREFYSGRGAKYNSSIKHHEIGMVKVSKNDYSMFLKKLKEEEGRRIASANARLEKTARIENAEKQGMYSIDECNYVELSEDESQNKEFDAARLAATLDISIADALLLNSGGKTYVFAKQLSSDKVLELYHPSLDCNSLSICINEVSKERLSQFKNEDWAKSPYSGLLGQTSNKNHFVC